MAKDGTKDMTGTTTKKLLGALVLTAAATGCVTNGDDFRSETNWIKEGETKQSDVRMMLGEPYSVGNSSGRPTWTYGFYRYRLFGKSHQKELKLYWKPDGTVETYSFTSSFPDDTGKGPAADVKKIEY
jgi:outer membrane protein assembly factor BamE (lipoprotein component of BamABCDE complex)